MMLSRYTQFAYFGIFAPRYNDKTVLLAKHKIAEHNKIVFLNAPSMGKEPYYVSGKTAKQGQKTSNGSIPCMAVKLSELQPLEFFEHDIKEVI